MGVVRVVVDVKKHDISQIKKTEFLPINITLVVKGDVLVEVRCG